MDQGRLANCELVYSVCARFRSKDPQKSAINTFPLENLRQSSQKSCSTGLTRNAFNWLVSFGQPCLLESDGISDCIAFTGDQFYVAIVSQTIRCHLCSAFGFFAAFI